MIRENTYVWENSYVYEKNSYTCIMYMISHIHTHWWKIKELNTWVKFPPQIKIKGEIKRKCKKENKVKIKIKNQKFIKFVNQKSCFKQIYKLDSPLDSFIKDRNKAQKYLINSKRK